MKSYFKLIIFIVSVVFLFGLSHPFIFGLGGGTPKATQNYYRWRNDASALNTNSGWLANQNVGYTAIAKNTVYRLRFEIADDGTAMLSSTFLLEYALRIGTSCGVGETYVAVPVTATTQHFEMESSSQYTDNDNTTSNLLTSTGTFSNGKGVEDPSNKTTAVSITPGQYTELEYALKATANATDGGNYCFRLTNNGSTTNFVYSKYAEGKINPNTAPTLPSLVLPTTGTTNVSQTPTFQTVSTDAESDNLQYELKICTDSGMSTGCTTFDQTTSNVGWSGQDIGTSAYSSGTTATYILQAGSSLAEGITYYWKTRAKDPTGSNTWSSTQATAYTLTTGQKPSTPSLVSPGTGTTNVSQTPTLKTVTTDPNGDSLQYKIELATAVDFTGTTQTFDLSTSSTGWSGVDVGTSAYSSGTTAVYIIPVGSSLAASTTYYWRSYAKDPAGTNRWSLTQTTPFSFTTLIPPTTRTIKVLTVAGGGAGSSSGGGGGAGGLLYDATYSVAEGSYVVVVGDGGAGGTGAGGSGEDSSFDGTIIATGGGGGGLVDSADSASNGGSGGGGGSTGTVQTNGGDGIAGQGNAGGTVTSDYFSGGYPGAGGGGAGAVGENPPNDGTPGNGGVGLDYSAVFGTTFGVGGWFAGGGGGSLYVADVGGDGGIGGGGHGGVTILTAGTPNTGGGGGANVGAASLSGANGGSGVVIVSFVTNDFGLCTSDGTLGVDYTITSFGENTIFAWLTPGNHTFTIEPIIGEMEVLTVAGGGAGSRTGGGGGAGGLIYDANLSVSEGNYIVVVGDGGMGTDGVGGSGEDSLFGTLIAVGGGGGGLNEVAISATGGGSGGGGGSTSTAETAGGSGIDGQGHTGGTVISDYWGGSYPGAGGGGAYAVGGNPTSVEIPGGGGAGLDYSISGSTEGYAGGGGGACWSSAAYGTGTHGGGDGGVTPEAGTANKGGGGGGGVGSASSLGGNGGSGIVIVSFVTADFGTCTSNGTEDVDYTITTSGTKTIFTWLTVGNHIFYTTTHPPNTAPTLPSLVLPTTGTTNVSQTPTFKTVTTDADGDPLQYELKICTDSGMSTGCTTFDQTTSNVGWSGQDVGTSAYSSGTTATYILQAGSSLAANTTYYWKTRAIDPAGSNTWSSTQTTAFSFTTLINNFTPSAPFLPYANNTTASSGQQTPVYGLIDHTPSFSAVFDDSDTSDTSSFYQLQINTDAGFTGTSIWDSTKSSIGSTCNENSRCADVVYGGGTSLVDGSTYYWHIKFWDNSDAEGSWSATQQFSMNNAPTVSNIVINGNNSIDLSEGLSVGVSWVATVTDADSYTNLSSATGKIYRSEVGSTCTLDNNNCYTDTTCDYYNCSGNSCSALCSANLYFFTEATDIGSTFASQYYQAWVQATDSRTEIGSTTSSSTTVDVNSISGFSIGTSLVYGEVFAGSNTGSSNTVTTVTNTGNSLINLEITGDFMCTDYPSCGAQTIAPQNQQFNFNTFTFGAGTTLTTSPQVVNIGISKPTQSPSNSYKNLYWGIGIPTLKEPGNYQGATTVLVIAGESAIAIGDNYQGGKIAYIDGTGIHGLIAATADQGASAWGCFGTTIPGADGTAIGTGHQNTLDIIAAGCTNAAQLTTGNINGYTDWYLPSKDELAQLYINRVAIDGFTTNHYWSSSEYGANFAWFQIFGSGYQNGSLKNDAYYIRAVRSF